MQNAGNPSSARTVWAALTRPPSSPASQEQAAEEEAGDDLPDLNDPDLAAAALKIQSLQRGRAARARVEDIKKAQAAGEVEIGGVVDADDVAEALNLSPEEAEAAAVRIQVREVA